MKNLPNIIARTTALVSAIAFAAAMAAPAFNFYNLSNTSWVYLLLLSFLGCFFGTAATAATDEKGGAE